MVKTFKMKKKAIGKILLITLLLVLPIISGYIGYKIRDVQAQGSIFVDYLNSLSGGDVQLNTDLNATQHEFKEGVFHTGTSFPSGPVEGQWFYRTDLNDFYFYNGSGWEGQVPPGESHIPCNFLIIYNGSHYQARNGRTGAFDSNNTDLYTVFNYALSNLDTYGGKIYLDLDGNHTLSTGLTLSGDGSRVPPRKTIIISGKGEGATNLQLASGIVGFTFSDDLEMVLENFCIYIPSGNGMAFNCTDGASLYGGVIRNIYIRNEGTNWAARLCPFLSSIYDLEIYSFSNGLTLENPGTAETIGNSEFHHITIQHYGDDTMGLRLLSTGSEGVNLNVFGFVMIQSDPADTGTIGLLLDGRLSGGYVGRHFFSQLHIEWEETCIKLDNLAIENILRGSYIMPNAGGTFINVASTNSYANRFGPFTQVQPAGAGAFTLITDATTSTSRPNIYEDIYTAVGTPSISVSSAILRDVRGIADYDIYGLGSMGIGVRRDADDYGGNFSIYTPPQGYEGMIIIAEDTNSGSPGRRIYAYSGGSWRYVALS